MAILGLKMVIFGLVQKLHFFKFFWTQDSTVTHKKYLESQLCSKITILSTLIHVAILGLNMLIEYFHGSSGPMIQQLSQNNLEKPQFYSNITFFKHSKS